MAALTQQQKRAYQDLRQRLLTGAVTARQPLSQRKLARELGVSSACVQMVLGRLESDGLVVRFPQTGTCLRAVDYREYCQNFDMRVLIEPYAAGQAARFITPAQLAQLEKACRKFDRVTATCRRKKLTTVAAELVGDVVQAEYQFHGTIMQACGNPTAAHVVENLHILQNVLYFSEYMPDPIQFEEMPTAGLEHRNILKALRAGAAEKAEKLMRQHLTSDRLYDKRTPPGS